MKNIISIVSAALALVVTSTGFAQEKTPIELPVGAKICWEAVSAPRVDPNPAAHPQCNGVDQVSLGRINKMAADLNALRKRLERVEATAKRAEQKADAAIAGVKKVDAKVDRLGERVTAVENGVGEVQSVQTALMGRMDAVSTSDATQNVRIAKLEERADKTDTAITDLQKTGNQLTLRASYALLAGLGGDTYAAPVVFPGLSLGLSPKTSLNIELGLTTSRSNGSSTWGSALKLGLSHDLKVATVGAGLATYALGVNKTSDATVIMSGLELGVSKEVGPVVLGINVMPVGINYATAHTPCYAIGGTLDVAYRF